MTGSAAGPGRTGHVLVVDDDDLIREVTKVALETVGGLEVTTASSGAECLDLAHTTPTGVILLDVMMPAMDGPTTLTHLREDPATREIPVILMTAKGLVVDRLKWHQLNVLGVITKPFDPLKLATQVKSLLGWE